MTHEYVWNRDYGESKACRGCDGEQHWVQIYGVYLCRECYEAKRVSSYGEHGLLHMTITVGNRRIFLDPVVED